MKKSMKFSADTAKSTVFEEIKIFLDKEGFGVANMDDKRPWGGFYVIKEDQALTFIERFFPEQNREEFEGFPVLSPKILIVEPDKRLSWQYHHRRAEIWKVIGGTAGVVISETDEQTPVQKLEENDVVKLDQGQRHRLVGTDEWGIIAEIWKHTDKENPSDENDIVRVEDDFGR